MSNAHVVPRRVLGLGRLAAHGVPGRTGCTASVFAHALIYTVARVSATPRGMSSANQCAAGALTWAQNTSARARYAASPVSSKARAHASATQPMT